MLDTAHHVWTLSEGGEASLGLSCTEDGLFLGRTPLLDHEDGRFVPRSQAALERLTRAGYGIDRALDRLMPGLSAVASALNENNLCRASIAAVHLRIPPLPDALARLAIETEDLLIKVEDRSNHSGSSNWDPAKHPRAGTAPNPGWFAPAGGTSDVAPMPLTAPQGANTPQNPNGDDRAKLPPGDRNDEIGDLLEWIANAKAEDVPAISNDISRIFYQHGDLADGAALHQALMEVLENPDQANRQRILNQLEPISHHNPEAGEVVATEAGIATSLGPLLSGARALLPATEETAQAASEAASRFWGLGWAARGAAIHDALGGNLPFGFRTIDDFTNGVATSIKSLDLNAKTYQDAGRLAYRLNGYIKKLATFKDTTYGEFEVNVADITDRILHVVVPKGSMTTSAKEVFDAAAERAKNAGITLRVTQF